MNIMNTLKKLIIYSLVIAACPALASRAASFQSDCASAKDPEVIRKHIAQGADPNKPMGASGMNSLGHAAYSNKNPEIIKALIAAGANVNYAFIQITAQNKLANGGTPLQIAADRNNLPALLVLIEGGADINLYPAKIRPGNYYGNKFTSATPLQIAIKKGHKEIVDALRRAGAKE